MRNIFFLATTLFLLNACSKGDAFESSEDFPLNWQMTDTFQLICNNAKDTQSIFKNLGYCALGVATDGNFGQTTAGYYASYETTLSSSSFSFASVDSIILIAPYVSKIGACDKAIDLAVYELTENIIDSTSNTYKEYAINNAPIGALNQFIPNTTDSVYDGSSKIGPALRIPLSLSFAQKLIAPGSYADAAAFRNVFKGLYLTATSINSSNGFIFIDITFRNRIKIYGKNASGTAITSEFITGSTNSITLNHSRNAQNSTAQTAATNTSASGDNLLYLMGTNGFFSKINIPDLKEFTKNNTIFKAELEFSVVDTGFSKVNQLGMTYYFPNDKKEYSIDDQVYKETLYSPALYTENGVMKYKFNIVHFLNKNISNGITAQEMRLFASRVLISGGNITKLSLYNPNRVVLSGKGSASAPKLKLYYVKK